MLELDKLKDLADSLGVRDACNLLFNDERFPLWSGSSKPEQHHYGNCGLIKHTLEVVELCLQTNQFFKPLKSVDDSDLFLAALYHDAGKMFDYRRIGLHHWGSATHKRMIHHISRSALIFNEASVNMPQEKRDGILHAILAHHGLREWGSPVSPKSRIAWLLHLCDCISARMDDCDKWDHVKP